MYILVSSSFSSTTSNLQNWPCLCFSSLWMTNRWRVIEAFTTRVTAGERKGEKEPDGHYRHQQQPWQGHQRHSHREIKQHLRESCKVALTGFPLLSRGRQREERHSSHYFYRQVLSRNCESDSCHPSPSFSQTYFLKKIYTADRENPRQGKIYRLNNKTKKP